MSLAYTPPGVTVNELASPSVSPLLAVPASICIVGMTAGVITQTDTVTLSGTTAVTLPSIPTTATMTSSSIVSVIAVVDPSYNNGNGFAPADYTLDVNAHTIARTVASNITDGSSVYVTYTYTPSDYFSPIRLDNLIDIESRFGSQYNSTGTAINSPLSYAAAIAFENGAQTVVCQPLFYSNAGVPQQPTGAQAAAPATWSSTYLSLRNIEDINVIIPIVGQSMASVGDAQWLQIVQTLQDHIYYMQTQDQYIIGIIGEDSSASSTVAQKATLLTHASTLQSRYGGVVNEAIVFIAPSKFSRSLPSSTGTLSVGGQYVASALGGMLASRSVAASLTRKTISGFASVDDPRSKAEKNTDAAAGLLEIEQRAQNIVVRHALTLDTTSVAKRELSVVRAKYRMIESVRDTIDTQVIGQVVADGNAPLVVSNAVAGVLQELVTDGDIVDFSDVAARTASLDPTVIEVRFSYRPAFPVNYVQVSFSIDLTTGSVNLPDTQSSTTDTELL